MDGGWPGLTGWIFGRFCGNLRGGNATVTADPRRDKALGVAHSAITMKANSNPISTLQETRNNQPSRSLISPLSIPKLGESSEK